MLIGAIVGVVIAIAALVACQRLLTPENQTFLQNLIMTIGAPAILGSGGIVLKGTNDRRNGKIEVQKAQAIEAAKVVLPDKYDPYADALALGLQMLEARKQNKIAPEALDFADAPGGDDA